MKYKKRPLTSRGLTRFGLFTLFSLFILPFCGISQTKIGMKTAQNAWFIKDNVNDIPKLDGLYNPVASSGAKFMRIGATNFFCPLKTTNSKIVARL